MLDRKLFLVTNLLNNQLFKVFSKLDR